jgi:tetratricopeptide (TPR) repeat protein
VDWLESALFVVLIAALPASTMASELSIFQASENAAETLARQGRFESAAAEYERALTLLPAAKIQLPEFARSQILINIVSDSIAAQRLEQARNALGRFIDLNRHAGDVVVGDEIQLLQSGRYRDASAFMLSHESRIIVRPLAGDSGYEQRLEWFREGLRAAASGEFSRADEIFSFLIPRFDGWPALLSGYCKIEEGQASAARARWLTALNQYQPATISSSSIVPWQVAAARAIYRALSPTDRP